MSLIARSSLRILNNISLCIRSSNWTKVFSATSSLRPLHQSCLLYGEGIPLRMPSLSPTMEEGRIVSWLKQEGDTIEAGDVLCEIETDKAVVSFDIDEDGVLAKILVKPDSGIIKIGTLIAVIAPVGEDWKTIDIPSDDAVPAGGTPAAASVTSAATPSVVATSDGRKFGPSVRLLLELHGLAAAQVAGTGPHGELLKGDVLKHVQQGGLAKVAQQPSSPPAAPAPPKVIAKPPPPAVGAVPGAYIDIELSGTRRTIAKRLLQSKSGIAHSYGVIECRLDELLALRRKFRNEGVALSVNDILVKAVAVALRTCPALNSVWRGDQLVVSPTIDISVAVAIPAGLITPIVFNADQLGIKTISDTIREMAGRAKGGKLKPEEFQGGTFTISNLGMFGVCEFSAIINPPQCGILAVGSNRIVIGPDGTPETRMRATLSYDRLAVDDDVAGEFLSALTEIIQNPHQMVLGRTSFEHLGEDHPLAGML